MWLGSLILWFCILWRAPEVNLVLPLRIQIILQIFTPKNRIFEQNNQQKIQTFPKISVKNQFFINFCVWLNFQNDSYSKKLKVLVTPPRHSGECINIIFYWKPSYTKSIFYSRSIIHKFFILNAYLYVKYSVRCWLWQFFKVLWLFERAVMEF